MINNKNSIQFIVSDTSQNYVDNNSFDNEIYHYDNIIPNNPNIQVSNSSTTLNNNITSTTTNNNNNNNNTTTNNSHGNQNPSRSVDNILESSVIPINNHKTKRNVVFDSDSDNNSVESNTKKIRLSVSSDNSDDKNKKNTVVKQLRNKFKEFSNFNKENSKYSEIDFIVYNEHLPEMILSNKFTCNNKNNKNEFKNDNNFKKVEEQITFPDKNLLCNITRIGPDDKEDKEAILQNHPYIFKISDFNQSITSYDSLDLKVSFYYINDEVNALNSVDLNEITVKLLESSISDKILTMKQTGATREINSLIKTIPSAFSNNQSSMFIKRLTKENNDTSFKSIEFIVSFNNTNLNLLNNKRRPYIIKMEFIKEDKSIGSQFLLIHKIKKKKRNVDIINNEIITLLYNLYKLQKDLNNGQDESLELKTILEFIFKTEDFKEFKEILLQIIKENEKETDNVISNQPKIISTKIITKKPIQIPMTTTVTNVENNIIHLNNSNLISNSFQNEKTLDECADKFGEIFNSIRLQFANRLKSNN